MKKLFFCKLLLSLISLAIIQPSWGKSISNIRIDPPSPSILTFGQKVRVSFEYHDIHTKRLRIFVRPYSRKRQSPRFAVESSPTYPSGSGKGFVTFTINPGKQVKVDEIKFSLYNWSNKESIFNFSFPTKYIFTSKRIHFDKSVLNKTENSMQMKISHQEEKKKNPRLAHQIKKPYKNQLHTKVKPELIEKYLFIIFDTVPIQNFEIGMQQVPAFRPPEIPTQNDAIWNQQMDKWLENLNFILMKEIELVVKDKDLLARMENFANEEQITLRQHVSLNLLFLETTQQQRSELLSNENN